MSESTKELLKVVRHCQQSLDKYTENRNEGKLLHYLEKLYKLPIKVVHLEETGVGRTVNGLRKLGGDVGDSAKSLVSKWKAMVVDEQDKEEDEEEEEEEEEDGYQTGQSTSTDEKEGVSSSHKKDKNREKERHNGHKHKHKRKSDSDSNDEEEVPKKKKKQEEEERERQKAKEEARLKEKKHKAEKERHREKREKEKEKKKERHKEHAKGSKKEESKKHSTIGKEGEKKKEKHRSKEEKKKSVVDSGSGPSFAEALGMCESSSSKGHKKKSEKKEKSKSKPEETVNIPKPLKEPVIASPEPIDLNLSSLLPPITPNYRPLGNNLLDNNSVRRPLTESEALINSITSKNQRTKVYSGNKMGGGTVPSLFELCIRILQDNIDALEYTGGVPYSVLKTVLEKANPNQLYIMEHHNPYLIEDTDELWQFHCQREFRNKRRDELESWREMYLRCLDERDAKLRALTANIKQSQDKSLPVRMTKLAYVDAVAKPPRNIARKQAKNGTAFDVRKATPTAKLSALATAGEAGRVAVPSPRSSTHAQKPKKAPLMLKSISSFKNFFKR